MSINGWREYVTDDELTFVQELAEDFGEGTTLSEARLRLVERAFAQECETSTIYHEIVEELSRKLAAAEGLAEGSEEYVERIVGLTLGRYHELRDERAQERVTA